MVVAQCFRHQKHSECIVVGCGLGQLSTLTIQFAKSFLGKLQSVKVGKYFNCNGVVAEERKDVSGVNLFFATSELERGHLGPKLLKLIIFICSGLSSCTQPAQCPGLTSPFRCLRSLPNTRLALCLVPPGSAFYAF
jgi:hypothetical protein